jgi:electron transport complex protein RnfG
MNKIPILVAAGILGAFAVGGVGLVAITHELTDERIAANERDAMLRKVAAIVPADIMDNDPLNDRVQVSAPDMLGAKVTDVYRVRSGDEPVAVILNPVVSNGYSGPIKLLVAVLEDGSLGGVRVLTHQETPGLGDRIEETKSDWIKIFSGKSLGDPPEERWKVKRDGGAFDQFTGATVTPRAIVAAVKGALQFVQSRGRSLYEQPAVAATPGKKGAS